MKHVSSFGLPQQVFLTKWFVCLFIDLLPVHTVLRVWDCLFYEGYKIIFRSVLNTILFVLYIIRVESKCKHVLKVEQ